MTVAITGGTGFLGSRIVRASVASGYEVVVLKRRSSDLTKLSGVLDRIRLFDLDLVDAEAMAGRIGRVQVLIHAATCYGRSGESPAQVVNANLLLPLQLLSTLSVAGCQYFVNTDTSLPRTYSRYALSKKQLLEWVPLVLDGSTTRLVNVKLENVYGPGDSGKALANHVIESLVMNVPEIPLTDGRQMRDFVYVDDAVSAYLALLKRIFAGLPVDDTYEVGTGTAISVRQFAETAHRVIGGGSHLRFGALKTRPDEIMESRADITGLARIGWYPKVGLEEGISRTAQSLSVSDDLRQFWGD